jgi:hypothetical protein
MVTKATGANYKISTRKSNKSIKMKTIPTDNKISAPNIVIECSTKVGLHNEA